MAKSSSFQPSFQKGGNSVFNDVTIRGTLKIGAAKKLVLVNENGKDVALKCNSDGAIVSNFAGNLTGNVTGISTGADRVKTVTASSENATHYLTMVDSHNPPASPKNETINTDQSLTFNPSTNTLTVGNVTGGEIYGTNINGEVGAGHTFYGKRVGGIISPGTPVQTVYGKSTTQVAVSSAQTYTVIQSVVLETIESGSMFHLNAYAHGYSSTNSPSTRANLGYSVTIDGTTTRIAGKDGSAGDSWGTQLYPGAIYSRPAIYAPDIAIPAGTTCTFNLLAASWDVSNSIWNYTGYGHESILVVSEIPEQAFGFGLP